MISPEATKEIQLLVATHGCYDINQREVCVTPHGVTQIYLVSAISALQTVLESAPVDDDLIQRSLIEFVVRKLNDVKYQES